MSATYLFFSLEISLPLGGRGKRTHQEYRSPLAECALQRWVVGLSSSYFSLLREAPVKFSMLSLNSLLLSQVLNL